MKTVKRNRIKYRRNKKGGGGGGSSGVKTKKNIKNKKTNTPEEFKQVKCSPASILDKSKEGDKNAFTCYNDDTLLKIRELWNSRHPDSKIDSKESYDIWKNVKNNMQDVCTNESCWIKQIVNDNKVNKEIISYTFAPTSPKEWKKNPNEWLSSIDIVKVMKQYEKAYTCFEFIGPSPIDFDTRMMYNECVWPELCNFEIEKYIKKGKNKIGIIFNTDPHYKDGSHWISLFINIRKRFILYFDSNGNDTPKEIIVLVDRILAQCKAIGIEDMKFYENKLEHQKTNTECGMYSLYLVIQLIKDAHTYDYFMKNRIKDEEVEKMRKEYFNEEGTI
jgi:hypothetical protein